MVTKYYVYRHLKLSDGTPFYVGKGKSGRAYILKHRTRLHKNISKKHGCKIEIVKYFESEKEAYDFECRLINLYKSFGHCKANLILDSRSPNYWIGKKFSNTHKSNLSSSRRKWKMTKETNVKISKILTGRSLSITHKRSISKSMTSDRYFKVFKNGEFIGTWNNIVSAARDLSCFKSHISSCLSEKRKSHKGYTFVW